jgi:heat shock protein HtpX
LGPTAPILSPRYNEVAREFGLKKVELTVVISALPMARVVSFTGTVARVNVTNRLLEILNEDEMVFVIAHELSHHRDHHYLVRLVVGAGALAVYLIGLWWITRRLSPAGDAPPEGGGELGLFLRLLPVNIALAAVMTLPLCAFCRWQEIEADRAAVSVTEGAVAAIGALEKLERTVPGFVRTEFTLFSTHPSTQRRIRAIREESRWSD